MIHTGDLDEGERWLQRAARALEADTGPGIRLLTHIASGMLQVGLGRLHEAAEGDPAAALGVLRDVLDGTAPVIGYLTVVEAHLLAGLAHRELGDQRAANQAAERALAEPDRAASRSPCVPLPAPGGASSSSLTARSGRPG